MRVEHSLVLLLCPLERTGVQRPTGNLVCAEQSFQPFRVVPLKPCNIQDSLDQRVRKLLFG